MADAIPSPAAAEQKSSAQSTVLVQAPMSQWSALKEAGWWTNFDWTVVVLIALLWLTGFYWYLFGHPATNNLIALLLVNVSLKLIWLISLVFRCSWFVLRVHADIATLPHESARIAVSYLSGQPAPRQKQ